MPKKTSRSCASPKLASSIKAMTKHLREQFGGDFSFQVVGQGNTVAKSSAQGVVAVRRCDGRTWSRRR